MKKVIKFNKPLITISEKRFISKVFKNQKFTDGEFQKNCEEFIKKKLNLNVLN